MNSSFNAGFFYSSFQFLSAIIFLVNNTHPFRRIRLLISSFLSLARALLKMFQELCIPGLHRHNGYVTARVPVNVFSFVTESNKAYERIALKMGTLAKYPTIGLSNFAGLCVDINLILSICLGWNGAS